MPWWFYPYYPAFAFFRYPPLPWYAPQYLTPFSPYSLELEKQFLLDMKAFFEEQIRYIEARLKDIDRQLGTE